jgi:hypothetical protein
MDVTIERLEREGEPLWQVAFGRRKLTFHEELAARTFAAQLHLRRSWLDAQPPASCEEPPDER